VIRTFICTAAMLAIPATAMAAEQRFTRDGVTYVYTTEERGDTTVISGKYLPDGRNYRLTVRGKRVTGFVDNVAVSFRIAKPLAQTLQTAQR
jgi:hypothetical protein